MGAALKLMSIFVLLHQASSTDLKIGAFGPSSQLVYNANQHRAPSFYPRDNEFVIEVLQPDVVITAIDVTDLREDKKGMATVTDGGLGQNHVTIRLRSHSAFREYNFDVKVYADTLENYRLLNG